MPRTDDLGGFIAVKRIKEISFSLDERSYIHDPTKIIRSDLLLTFGHIIDRNLVQLVIRIYYYYEDLASPPHLVDTEVQTVFEIAELNRYQIGESEIKLPPDVIILLIDLAVSHARAFLARNLQGTAWQENILGVVNPVSLAKFYFASMFEDVPGIRPNKTRKGSARSITGKKQSKNT